MVAGGDDTKEDEEAVMRLAVLRQQIASRQFRAAATLLVWDGMAGTPQADFTPQAPHGSAHEKKEADAAALTGERAGGVMNQWSAAFLSPPIH